MDWQHENHLAGLSRDGARLFLARAEEGPVHPMRVWLNLDSVPEVNALHDEWRKSGVRIVSAPEQKPWGLHEFTAEDPDGNSFRVFHDTETPKRHAESGAPGAAQDRSL